MKFGKLTWILMSSNIVLLALIPPSVVSLPTAASGESQTRRQSRLNLDGFDPNVVTKVIYKVY